MEDALVTLTSVKQPEGLSPPNGVVVWGTSLLKYCVLSKFI